MPLIGIVLQGINFSELSFTIGSSVVKYGAFLQSIVDFVIVAFCIFIMVKQIQRFKKTPEAKAAEPTMTEKLLIEIRDELKSR